jgi:hypothetical protein
MRIFRRRLEAMRDVRVNPAKSSNANIGSRRIRNDKCRARRNGDSPNSAAAPHFRCGRFFMLALPMLLGLTLSASATTFMRMSLEQLVSAAPLIVRARCQGSIVSAERGEIRTITSFEVRELWKGSAPAVLRVRLLGGRTAQLTSHVEGVPQFRTGEDVVLFLEPKRNGTYSVVSWAQGTFRIHRAGADAREVVTQDSSAFAPSELLHSRAPQSVRMERSAPSAPEPVRNMPLEVFRARVAALR